jgi:hypothetical protein
LFAAFLGLEIELLSDLKNALGPGVLIFFISGFISFSISDSTPGIPENI